MNFYPCSCLSNYQNCLLGVKSEISFFPLQKEERTMLEDTKAALLDLDKVTVFFRQLEDECLVASKRVHQQRKTWFIQTRLLLMSSCIIGQSLNKVPLC